MIPLTRRGARENVKRRSEPGEKRRRRKNGKCTVNVDVISQEARGEATKVTVRMTDEDTGADDPSPRVGTAAEVETFDCRVQHKVHHRQSTMMMTGSSSLRRMPLS